MDIVPRVASPARRSAVEQVSLDEARRIALGAQGFGEPRPNGRVDVRHLRRVIDRIGVLQLDSVNVLCRSHYLPLFSRLGPYPRSVLDRMVWGGARRELFEYWAHRASVLPLRTHALLRWRMHAARHQVWGSDLRAWRRWLDPAVEAPWAVVEGMSRLSAAAPDLADEVLAVVAESGPVTAREVGLSGERRLEHGGLWNWNDTKVALEWLFSAGKVTTADRWNFERIYDLTERVLPDSVLAASTPSQEDAQRELVRIAARAQGVATEAELRGYFHLPAEHSKARVAELVADGELIPVRVDGIAQQMYLWSAAQSPAALTARALLSPFDSLIWDRDRMLRLFGFHYRISIYTPAARRAHGYYVLPFLFGDRLVARVDLRADRERGALLALSAYAEPDARHREIAAGLAEELRLMADWLELDRVVVSDDGDLGPALRRAARTPRSRAGTVVVSRA